tara:strand:+ start:5710 stop:5868 length:159 start_codon:yes stop_codon:yes gene_type:complete
MKKINWEICSECNGHGKVTLKESLDEPLKFEICGTCNGSGTLSGGTLYEIYK